MTKALVGKEIVVKCVKIVPQDNKKMILDRPLKFAFKHKSKERTGRLSEAYLNFKYERGADSTIVHDDKLIILIREKLNQMFGCDYEVIFDKSEILKGETLIGECSDTQPKCKIGKMHHFPEFSATHGGQGLKMLCKIAALCYRESHPYEINTPWRCYEK